MNVNTSNKWTRALWEPTAGVLTNKANVALGDIHGKNDYHLILVDENESPCRLKLYKGLRPVVESVLLESPAGIVSFIADPSQTESPCLAVACGASLLIYRNMKPYYRYNIPQMDILPAEAELWSRVRSGQLQREMFVEGLKLLQAEHSIAQLSFQSQQLLTLPDPDEDHDRFVDHVLAKETKDGGVPLANIQITCIATIQRNQSQTSAVDVLIVGTERGSVYFVDSQAYTVLRRDNIGAVPVKLLPIGHFDLEYRIVICTRDHEVYILRRNLKGEFSESSFYVREHAFDVVCCANQLVFATRKNRLIFFSVKGRRQNSMQFNESIVDIEQFYYEPRQYNGVLVVLGSEIHLYVDQFRVDTIRMDRPIEWIRFGKMDREEGVLVIAVLGGGLCVKIWRRVAVFDEKQTLTKKTTQKAIEIPRKSKTFVEQSLREREKPQMLHQIYQRDWFMVKYNTTKTYAALESGKTELVPSQDTEPIQFNYDVLGFGPRFQLIIRMTCPIKLETKTRWLAFFYNAEEYEFSSRIIPVPALTPNQWLIFHVDIECLHPDKQLNEETVRLVFAKSDSSRPVWMTSFCMPISEQNVLN